RDLLNRTGREVHSRWLRLLRVDDRGRQPHHRYDQQCGRQHFPADLNHGQGLGASEGVGLVIGSSAARTNLTSARSASASSFNNGRRARSDRYSGNFVMTTPPKPEIAATSSGVTAAWISTRTFPSRSISTAPLRR